jgi:hypothetical protein
MEKMTFLNPEKQSREEQFLFKVVCLLPEAGSDYREQLRNSFFVLDEERLWRLSLDCKVTAVFSHRLADLLGWENIPPRWREFHDAMAEQVNFYCDEIDFVAQELNASGIKVIALKNDSIVRAFNLCGGCCPMSDIDILIENTYQQQADTILGGLGYKHYWADNSSLQRQAEKSTSYFKVTPSGEFMFLDVHWEAIGVRWMSGDLGELTSMMVERSLPIPGTTARIFSPEDNLFQVVLHNAKHAYRQKPGFMRNLDVHRIIEHQEINWRVFLDLINTHKIKTAAYFSLSAPVISFGTSVPKEVLGAMGPPFWKKPFCGFLQSAWFFNSNKTKLRSLTFRMVRVMLYDDLTIVIRNGISSFWRRRRKWRLFYLLRDKLLGLWRNNTKSFEIFPIVFHGPGSYKNIFKGSGYTIVLEDDGQEGYVYVTKEDGSQIFHVLKLYDQGDAERISDGDLMEILWHPKLKKVGVKYHGKIQAIFDIKKNTSYSMGKFSIEFPLGNVLWRKTKNYFLDDSVLSEFEGINYQKRDFFKRPLIIGMESFRKICWQLSRGKRGQR